MNGPMDDAVDVITEIANSESINPDLQPRIQDTVDSLETAEGHAAPELQPFVGAVIVPLDQVLKVFAAGGGDLSLDFSDMKAAAYELSTRCEPYL